MNEREPLNVLLLHCHDLGRFMGCYGVETVRTPHLDALANDGVRFDSAFCTAPQCSPSRASLFTGRWPQSHGVMGLTHGNFAWDLKPGEQHLGAMLSDAGYHTELIGVHHESREGSPAQIAHRLGFDSVELGGKATEVADRTVAALGACAARDEPFYLQVGFFEPHRLLGQADDDFAGFISDYIEPDDELGVSVPGYLRNDAGTLTEIAELQGAVRYMDAAADRVLQALDKFGLTDDTVVIFTTDHGLALPRAKGTLYDPGLEVALLLRAPALGWVGGRVVDSLISNVDILPTLLSALDLQVPENVQGRSFLPALTGDDFDKREYVFGQFVYHDYYDPRRSIRTRDHKLIVNFSSAPAFLDTSQSWRPRSTPRVPLNGPNSYHPPVELYDLRADPFELENIVDRSEAAPYLDDLRCRLLQWMKEVDDPILDGAIPSPLHHRAIAHLTRRSAHPR